MELYNFSARRGICPCLYWCALANRCSSWSGNRNLKCQIDVAYQSDFKAFNDHNSSNMPLWKILQREFKINKKKIVKIIHVANSFSNAKPLFQIRWLFLFAHLLQTTQSANIHSKPRCVSLDGFIGSVERVDKVTKVFILCPVGLVFGVFKEPDTNKFQCSEDWEDTTS